MTNIPFSNAGQLFQQAGDACLQPVFSAPDIGAENRTTCRWCLNPFDVSQQHRSTPERGYLRTNLRMADNGSELVCCDECWQGAIGTRVWTHGRVVPSDPSVIDNPLLRMIAK